MAFISMRAAPPTRRHLRHWERVCRFLDGQPYRAVSLPLPVDPPMSVRLFKRMAVFRLVRHRDDCRWQLSPRWRAILRRLWDRLPANEPACEASGPEEAERVPFVVDTGVDTFYVNLKAHDGLPPALIDRCDALKALAQAEDRTAETPWLAFGAPLSMYKSGVGTRAKGRGVSWSYILRNAMVMLLLRKSPLSGLVGSARLSAECLWTYGARDALDRLRDDLALMWSTAEPGNFRQVTWQLSQIHLCVDVANFEPDPADLSRLLTRSRKRAIHIPSVHDAESAAVGNLDADTSFDDAWLTDAAPPAWDGVPLALELAAARVKLLAPAALLARLEHQLPLLTSGAQDVDARQQTMRNTLAWSEGLLAPEEQRLLRRLAVFVGGFTLESAEAICTAPEGVAPLRLEVLDGLGALIDQSLVQRGTGGQTGGHDGAAEGGGGSEARFRLLYVIREYALEQLEASGETDALRRAHAAYYVALAEQMLTVKTYEEHLANIERLEVEQDNLRAVLAWLRMCAEAARQAGAAGRPKAEQAGPQRDVETPVVQGLRLAGALVWAWAYRGHLSEGRAWLEAFLALETTRAATAAARSRRTLTGRAARQASVRALALYAAGVLAYWQGDSDAAVPLLEQSLALARALGDHPPTGDVLTGYVLSNLGMALQDQDHLARACTCYEEGLALGQALDDRFVMANALGNLARLALAAGDLDQAEARAAETVAVSRQPHYHIGTAVGLVVQALIAWRRGDLSRAAALAREALVLYQAAEDVRRYGEGLEVCAIIYANQGHTERAARLLGAAAASRARISMTRPIEGSTAADIESAVDSARAALGAEAWAAAFAAGQALSLEEAVAEALDEAGSTGRTAV